MDCSIGSSILFCSISRGSRILYSHGGDRELETLASAAVESAPPLHSSYSHTAGGRTFAFLMDDEGHTYFAIVDASTARGAAALRFLEVMRDGFRRASMNGFHDELVPVVRRLIASLEALSFPPQPAREASHLQALSTTAEAPLLTKSGGDEKAKGSAEEMWIDIPPSGSAPLRKSSMPLQKSLRDGDWMQQDGRRLWLRHVKIVVAMDVLLCMVLFGIWLAVCRGFQCIA